MIDKINQTEDTIAVSTTDSSKNIQDILECLERFATTVVEVLDTAGYNTQYLDVIVRDLYKAINAYTCR